MGDRAEGEIPSRMVAAAAPMGLQRQELMLAIYTPSRVFGREHHLHFVLQIFLVVALQLFLLALASSTLIHVSIFNFACEITLGACVE